MNEEWTFRHAGVEANQILMNIIKKTHVDSDKFGLKSPLISPNSNDNKDTVKDEIRIKRSVSGPF